MKTLLIAIVTSTLFISTSSFADNQLEVKSLAKGLIDNNMMQINQQVDLKLTSSISSSIKNSSTIENKEPIIFLAKLDAKPVTKITEINPNKSADEE
jgi:hypothetical protein